MSVSIFPCPTCKTLLLADTIQCPTCKHVFDKQRVKALSDGPLPSERGEDSQEDPCPNCGEMVRRGLVRCWNCSSFMRKDIADSYRKMQTAPSPVIYSQSPQNKSGSSQNRSSGRVAAERDQPPGQEPSVDELMATDEDFELAPGVAQRGRDEDDFNLTPDVQQSVREAKPTRKPAVAPKAPAARQAGHPSTKPAALAAGRTGFRRG
jgi:hypothetical protein